jgi:hypothetical protein
VRLRPNQCPEESEPSSPLCTLIRQKRPYPRPSLPTISDEVRKTAHHVRDPSDPRKTLRGNILILRDIIRHLSTLITRHISTNPTSLPVWT